MAALEMATVAVGLCFLVGFLFKAFQPRRSPALARKALVAVQTVPPLLHFGAGVSKRYLTVCRELIQAGWQVTLMTNIDAKQDAELGGYIRDGSLKYIPVRGVRLNCPDGMVTFMDLTSFNTTWSLLKELIWVGEYDICILEDSPWRILLLMLLRALGVPSVITSHTDSTHLATYQQGHWILHRVWELHMHAALVADMHTTVSNQFAKIIRDRYHVPVHAVWPTIRWSPVFAKPVAEFADEAAAMRVTWESKLGFKPTTLFMYAGRWAFEKRIEKLFDAIPEGCALVVVGDGVNGYAENMVQKYGHLKHVYFQRRMLGGHDLRVAYAAADVFVSASRFETLGNTVIESWCAGTPVALQPAQGHLEFCKEGVNGFFVDYDDVDKARARLAEISDGRLWTPDVLPELLSTGERFRSANFYEDFSRIVLMPAIQKSHRRKAAIVESLVRLGAGVGALLAWPIVRIINRVGYMVFNAFSEKYKFTVVPTLGGCP
eukprot:m.97561 g.97561  ORF g.97561 m.97561 type:complete len:490 (-) comp15227_c3_seq1:469-1938(-)